LRFGAPNSINRIATECSARNVSICIVRPSIIRLSNCFIR
jgi:hypothetical protein